MMMVVMRMMMVIMVLILMMMVSNYCDSDCDGGYNGEYDSSDGGVGC